MQFYSPKTLEWHQTALSQIQQYLLAERQLVLVSQMTETDVRNCELQISDEEDSVAYRAPKNAWSLQRKHIAHRYIYFAFTLIRITRVSR